MSNSDPRAHIASDELIDYCEGILPEGQEGEIDEHLVECEACTVRVRQFRTFDAAWTRWTSFVPEARLGVVLATALRTLTLRASPWQSRLRHWQQYWGSKAQAALHFMREASGKASSIEVADLEDLLFPGGGWQVALAPGLIRTRGAVRVRGVTRTRGTSQPHVTVRSQAGGIEVRAEHLPPGQKPLVLLIPTTEGSEAKVQQLEEQGGVLIARFDGVESGDYVVVVEPVE